MPPKGTGKVVFSAKKQHVNNKQYILEVTVLLAIITTNCAVVKKVTLDLACSLCNSTDDSTFTAKKGQCVTIKAHHKA